MFGVVQIERGPEGGMVPACWLNLVVTAAVVVMGPALAEPLICMFDGTSPGDPSRGAVPAYLLYKISLIYAAMCTLDLLLSAWEQTS